MQILIWGDEMRRQISICIFLAFVVIALALLYIMFMNDNGKNTNPKDSDKFLVEEKHTEDHTEKESSVELGANSNSINKFSARNLNGMVYIFDEITQSIYMETGLFITNFPPDIQENLMQGMYFKNEEQLFSFLESYSS